MKKSLIFLLFLFYFTASTRVSYTNPIVREDAPDPTIIKANGLYYLYATGEKIYRSNNMINWQYVRKVFEGKTRPSFVDVSSYWAPCITKQDNRYVLYFALSTWGGVDAAGIGVATASTPEGPFDIANGNGKLFQSGEVGVKNSIDPNYIEENGRKYIIWGSFYGIYGIELNSDGLTVKDTRNKFQLAGTYFEAPYIYKRGGYYYLFGSIGSCCEGDNSTYQTVVGRSTSFTGPYTARNGGRMLDNSFEVLLSGNSVWAGPGHNSRIIEDNSGTTWMTYHAYIRGQSNIGRTALIDEVKWSNDGWPYFTNGVPSNTQQEGPDV
jgi:arabinan endo-1,5-alpha-L-arabinosidase